MNCKWSVIFQQLHIRGSREDKKRSLLEVNEHFWPTDNKVDGADECLQQSDSNESGLLGIVLILLCTVFWIIHIYDGHFWGDDFAQYILHAENFLRGKPYSDTGYIFNPYNPFVGPPSYPPVFPILLTPALFVFGVSFIPLKITICLFLGAFLYLLYTIAVKETSPVYGLILVTLFGFHAEQFYIANSILSDVPFSVFVYLLLVILNSVVHQNVIRNSRNIQTNYEEIPKDLSNVKQLSSTLLTATITLLYFLSLQTRTIGIILLPHIFFTLAIEKYSALKSSDKKSTRPRASRFQYKTITFCLIAVTAFSYQDMRTYSNSLSSSMLAHSFNHFPQTLLQTSLNFKTFFRNASLYINDITNFLSIPRFLGLTMPFFDMFMTAYFLFFCAIGGILFIKKRMYTYPLFSLLYGTFLCFWPANQGFRFLLPILPFLLLFFAASHNTLLPFLKKNMPNLNYFYKAFVISFIILLNYYSVVKVTHGTHQEEIRINLEYNDSPSAALFAFIKNKTEKDAKFLFPKPRALALFGERSAAAPAAITVKQSQQSDLSLLHNHARYLEKNLSFIKEKGINYLIETSSRDILFSEYTESITELLSFYTSSAKLLYRNELFAVYKLQ
jgi:hypothetical protein